MTASSPPISTTSSSWATIFVSTPDVGAGISVSTLSVETSSNGSSASTVSPSSFSHRVTVPSVTLSPRAGIWTEKAIVVDSSTRRMCLGYVWSVAVVCAPPRHGRRRVADAHALNPTRHRPAPCGVSTQLRWRVGDGGG
ncbi:Uncharacterised protein [Mycobacteroides abscessus subsp. abscessus]|nr:Uncharacterised protein [Mycobacteroides abscessus subsp. abscessus]